MRHEGSGTSPAHPKTGLRVFCTSISSPASAKMTFFGLPLDPCNVSKYTSTKRWAQLVQRDLVSVNCHHTGLENTVCSESPAELADPSTPQ